MNQWPANQLWNEKLLRKNHGDIEFACGMVNMSLNRYFDMMKQQSDERPLYLFDKEFGEKRPELLADYQVPTYFNNDLFHLLPNPNDRPRFRWWLIGPKLSGSTFHKDPNLTSAWNGIISGKKKWIMYPPHDHTWLLY